MATSKRQAGARRARKTKSAAPFPDRERAPQAAMPRRAVVTPRAAARARAAFEGFSLSKYRDRPTPPTHVPPGARGAAVQRTVMERALRQIAEAESPSNGLTLSLAPQTLNAIPSYDAGAGTIDAEDMMNVLARYMKGTEFYVQGHPMATRLELQTRVRDLIDAAIQKVKA